MKTNVLVLAGAIGSAFPAFAAGGGPIVINLSGSAAAMGAAGITVDGSPYTPARSFRTRFSRPSTACASRAFTSSAGRRAAA